MLIEVSRQIHLVYVPEENINLTYDNLGIASAWLDVQCNDLTSPRQRRKMEARIPILVHLFILATCP